MFNFIAQNRQRLAMLVVALHAVFFAGWYMHEADVFRSPIATIKVKTVAYDPRDLLSGQYIRLQYEFSRLASEVESMDDGKLHQFEIKPFVRDFDPTVWAILKPNADIYVLEEIVTDEPMAFDDGKVIVKGRFAHQHSENMIYGIEKYFVPEGTSEPNRDKTIVELDIYKNGKARIKQIYVDGAPWP